MLYESESGEISIALAGDCMLSRRLSVFREQNFLSLVKLLKEADVTFANLESGVHEYREGSPTLMRGTYMVTEPHLLEDLKWMGVNLVSCANNHTCIYGEEAILATIRYLDRAGIIHAGTGRNLSEARAPGYMDTSKGRVALIAAIASSNEWNRAIDQSPDFQGRPGLNALGFQTLYTADREAYEQLQRISTELGLEAEKKRLNRFGFASPVEIGQTSESRCDFLKNTFLKGEEFAIHTKPDPRDMVDNLRWLREARRQADWVIVSLHCHEMGGPSFKTANVGSELEHPADLVQIFAHRCVEEGADVFVGHGPHFPLGIEIYQGKPIFYSIGNFIFENETIRWLPAHAYDRFGLNYKNTPADFLDTRSDKDAKGHPAEPLFWQNIVAVCRFKQKKLDEVVIYPIDLGYGRTRPQRGRPVLADQKTGQKIIERVARLSRPYGTNLEWRDSAGVIKV